MAAEAESGTVSATVRLFREGDVAGPTEVASRLANRDGSFQFCGLAVPGKYRVVVDMGGYDRVASEFDLSLATPRRPRLEIFPQSRRAAQKEAGADSLAGYDELLERFSEPGLCSGGRGAKASYRLVWIRDEDPPLVLEVRFEKDGSITAERQTLALASGVIESSGKIDLVALHKARGGGSFVASRVRSQAEDLFWDESFRLDLAEEADLAAGSFWVAEGVRGDRCHVAERWSPDADDPVRQFAETLLLEIAETRLFVDELY